MSDVAAATGAAEGMPTAAPLPVQPMRLSDMNNRATVMLQPLDGPPPPAKPATPPQSPPQSAPPPEVAEGEPLPELEAPPAEEQPPGPTPEELAAEYQRLKDSPDLDVEAFGDKVLWVRDGDGNPVPMRVADVERHVMLYGDYQKKTTQVARERREMQQQMSGMQAFQRDLVSGDPELAMRALRYAGADKSLHAIVVGYVQRMARLEGLAPDIREEFLAGERARDEAEQLKRQLAARQQQEEQWRQQEAQQQGINAPDIQHVMAHIEQRLPAIYKELGVVESPAFDRLLGEAMTAATEGKRGQDGRWIEAPVIQRGRTPTDDVLRQVVGTAREQLQALIASGRQPPTRAQLPPPPAAAAVTGPAARPGSRGHIGQPERMRWSDMGKPQRR